MISPLTLGILFAGISVLLALLVALKTDLASGPGGKVLIFIALFIFPVVASLGGASEHIERSKRTSFCLSCHVMGDYGKSLYVDDKSYVPAVHFQNHRVPPDEACYTCHTDYTLYGGLHSKLRGLRHVYIQFFGTVPQPKDIKLYEAYNNRECLHCHLGARSFEEHEKHKKTEQTMADIKSNKLSCMAKNCHDTVHDVDSLKDVTLWKGGQ
jgi:cytochrome c-type protein NapC